MSHPPESRDDGLDFETLLASSVHDMKNSLGLVLDASEEIAARLEGEQPELDADLYRMQREARRLQGALVQLLTLYRIGRGELSINLEERPVADLLEEIAAELQPLFQHAGIEVTVDASPDLEWVYDESLVAGILRNTLGNLLRFARHQVRLAARVEDGWLRLALQDDGPGYPPHVIAAAGQAPGQAPGRGTVRRTGTGLGLYFAARAAAAHETHGRKGRIRIANEGPLGGGSLIVLLP